jgi:hypothetical protein
MEVKGELHAYVALPLAPIVQEAGWAPRRSGHYGGEKNILPLPRI